MNPPLHWELMNLSQKIGVWGETSKVFSPLLCLQILSEIAVAAAIEYEEEQFPWV